MNGQYINKEKEIMKKNNLKKLLAGLSAACVMASALPFAGFAAEEAVSTKIGDSNCDGVVELADAILIMQALANPNKYGVSGTDSKHITDKGLANADVDTSSKGLTSNDALRIQEYLLHKITSLEPTE